MLRLVDRVQDEARELDPLRLVLTVLAVPLVVVGWLAGNVVRGALFVLVWMWAAVRVGYRDARRKRGDG